MAKNGVALNKQLDANRAKYKGKEIPNTDLVNFFPDLDKHPGGWYLTYDPSESLLEVLNDDANLQKQSPNFPFALEGRYKSPDITHSVKRVWLSSRDVLNGEWFQVYGEGCDGSLLKRHPRAFLTLTIHWKSKLQRVFSDGSTSRNPLTFNG
jgi:hypothetical protein